jgi:predicted dehydrogenase
VADRHGVCAFHDIEQGLGRPDIAVVIIATPHAEHAALVRTALDAGKHVLCEKPLAIEASQAYELAIEADERGLRLATGFNHRFYPPVQEAMHLLHRWAIGRVESLRVEIGHRASAQFLNTWHTEPELSGGGSLMDNGPHACDLIRQVLGEVASTKGYVVSALDLPDGCESEAFALFRNHDRGIAELRTSWTLESGYLSLQIRGSEGHLHIETAPWRLSGVLSGGGRVLRTFLPERLRERAFHARYGCERSLVSELEAFLSPASVPLFPCASGWDGFRATEMIQAVYKSARTGEEVALPPQVLKVRGRQVSVRRSSA